MAGDISGALVEGLAMEPLDRIGDAGVQALLAWNRNATK
jgi:hypothetical protein